MDNVVNGKVYDVRDNGYIYLDGKRVSKQTMFDDMEAEIKETTKKSYDNSSEVLERAEQRKFNKGIKMEYSKKVEAFGISKAELQQKVGHVAYKPMSEYQGKEYAGSFLVNLRGKAKVISELTFQGKLQMFDVNTKTLGFYMADLFNIADTKQIGEFQSVRPQTLSLDDLGTVEEAEQLVDTISIWRVKFADLDMVTFLNETTCEYHGTKLYQVYEAEQKARLTRPSLNDMWEESMEAEVQDIGASHGEDKVSA